MERSFFSSGKFTGATEHLKTVVLFFPKAVFETSLGLSRPFLVNRTDFYQW